MKKISEDDMLAFVDGTLDADRAREVEEFLAHNEDEAPLAHDMKMALDALHDWDAAEPVAVSAAFWPELRDKLPAQPGRRGVRGLLAQWGLVSPLGQPSRAVTFSARAAVVAAGVALLALFFAPQKATQRLEAEPFTAADKAFIQQSLKRHEAYEINFRPCEAIASRGFFIADFVKQVPCEYSQGKQVPVFRP